MSLEDYFRYRIIFDAYDIHELIDKLIELEIITKEVLLREFWHDIEEEYESFEPFNEEEE